MRQEFCKFSVIRTTLCILMCGVVLLLSFVPWGAWGNAFLYQKGALAVHYVDVGHGDCTILQFPDGRTMIIDGGEETYWSRVDTYIRKRIKKGVFFDWVVNTHPHSDHLGGLLKLMGVYKYGAFVNYENFGDYLTMEGAGYSVKLHSTTTRNVDDANELSPIITIEYGDNVFIVTGDAGFSAEREFIEDPRAQEIFAEPKTTYLQVGHHGSLNSTGEYFLDFIKPAVAVVPVGTRFATLPNASVMERLTMRCGAVYNTRDDGNIVVQCKVGSETKMYFAFDNPPDLTFLWLVLVGFVLLFSFNTIYCGKKQLTYDM